MDRFASISVCHPSTKIERLFQNDVTANIIDVTSRSDTPWVRFSPFYPHGGIPIPFWPGRTSRSVEGIWQGLKRFENENHIDAEYFENSTMKHLKRTSKARGKEGVLRGRVLGHQCGDREGVLLSYLQARYLIYLPSYRWVLDHKLGEELAKLRLLSAEGPIVLLDYATNGDVRRLDKPLSHASLIRAYLNEQWPAPEIDETEILVA